MVPAKLVLFDMDRTLVRKNTAALFTRYRRERGEVGWMDELKVAWWLMKYTIGMIDAPRVAEAALSTYRGVREKDLEALCHEWFQHYVLPHVAEHGRRAVREHVARGELPVIVTGATRYAAMPLARELGIEHVVCTELMLDAEGCLTGQLAAPLCFGHGKIEAVGKLALGAGFDLRQATFYSDSVTDLPLLEYVHTPVAVNPDTRLRRIARRRSWRIERW